ncbi:MAG: hypothetical protein B7O98_09160 [Zestosphaera tikiterensis]|uniref:ATPase BadF/BadG/BcrA/BcrD type domain-containing protein n=1 Tax=Zestosphaera tikiterensis TaxID=1973259 RepID=A0A2R7Y2H7_9CREN|nr:MAG: hypothetical protein B7O98_09160 [Zestosphaera tikiterensis]
MLNRKLRMLRQRYLKPWIKYLRCSPALKKVVLGVDAGASKTEIAALDLSGSLVGLLSSKPANPSATSVKVACKNVVNGVRKLVNNLKDVEVVALGVGMAGVINEESKEVVRSFVGKSLNMDLSQVHVFEDVLAAHVASFAFGDGIVAVLGTGSCVFGVYKGRNVRFGGWGHLLGDEGSAYRIGNYALREYLKFLEGRDRHSTLHKLLESRLGSRSVSDVLATVYRSKDPKGLVASLAPYVFNAFKEGDALAREIIEGEICLFSEQIVAAAEALGMKCPEVSVVGGVFEGNKELVKSLLIKCLERKFSACELIVRGSLMRASCASALIALKKVLGDAYVSDALISAVVKECSVGT